MRRWLLAMAVVILAVCSAAALRSHLRSEEVRSRLRSEAARKREAGYQSVLQAYSENLKPGSTREEVEKYIRAKGATFFDYRSASEDLVKIGEDDHPWYCSEDDVYVEFDFSGTDTLESVQLSRQLGGCL